MLFAALCLRNALYLVKNSLKRIRNDPSTVETTTPNVVINEQEREPSEDQDNLKSECTDWMHINENGCCNPSGAISKDVLEKLRCSIYAASSYVSLRLGDYVTALSTAKELLRMEKISDAYRYYILINLCYYVISFAFPYRTCFFSFVHFY